MVMVIWMRRFEPGEIVGRRGVIDGGDRGGGGRVGSRWTRSTGRSRSAQRNPFKRLFAFLGPAYLVSVGYMDPGNWATDLEGGARFGYALIWVLLMSNLMAVLLQTLAARLGVVTGHDLAQACRAEYSRPVNFVLWLLAEVAIAATDLAEVLGHDHRAEAPVRHAAALGLPGHGVRHVPAALAPAVGDAEDGGGDPGPGGDDRRLLPGPDLPGPARPRRRSSRASGRACRRGRCSSRSASSGRR